MKIDHNMFNSQLMKSGPVSRASVEQPSAPEVSKDNSGRTVIRRNSPRHGLSRSDIRKKLFEKTGDVEFLRPQSKQERLQKKAQENPQTQLNEKASETAEKLKNVLSTGAFNFSDKERNTLEKIIG